MSPRKKEVNEALRSKKRKSIVDAAFELFANHGYARTSISDIAKGAGVSKGLIYHYFRSKEEILQAIYYSLKEMWTEMGAINEQATPAERLKAMIEGAFVFIETMTNIARITTALIIQPSIPERLKPLLDDEKENQIREAVHIFKEMGYEDPLAEAFYLGAKLDGMMLGYLTLKNDYPLEIMKQKILNEYVGH